MTCGSGKVLMISCGAGTDMRMRGRHLTGSTLALCCSRHAAGVEEEEHQELRSRGAEEVEVEEEVDDRSREPMLKGCP